MGIEEKLVDVPPGSIVMLELSAEENQMKLVAEFLRFKEKNNSYGVYVSTNRPLNNLIEKVKNYGYDLKKDINTGCVWVVDLVSKNVGVAEMSEMNGVIYVSSASELSAIQIAIEKAINLIYVYFGRHGPGWLFLDSIATLLVFNSPDSLLEFLHFLLGRLRTLEFDGVILTLREGIDVKVISTIKQFCDVIMKL